MRPGRSADVLSGWLKERDPSFREQIQVVTMDGFTGYATAVEEQLPQADKVMKRGMHCVEIGASESVPDALVRVIADVESEGRGVSMQILAIRDILVDMEERGVLSAFLSSLKGETSVSTGPAKVHSG